MTPTQVIVFAIVGWLLAIASLVWNVYQFRHARRTKVKVTVKVVRDTRPQVKNYKWLQVDVENIGTKLNDVSAVLLFKNDAGDDRHHPIDGAEPAPDPFEYGYSHTFKLRQSNRFKPYLGFGERPLDGVTLAIYSGARIVYQVAATKRKAEFESFFRSDEGQPEAEPEKSTKKRVAYLDEEDEGWKG